MIKNKRFPNIHLINENNIKLAAPLNIIRYGIYSVLVAPYPGTAFASHSTPQIHAHTVQVTPKPCIPVIFHKHICVFPVKTF